jgi:hypothetical protein
MKKKFQLFIILQIILVIIFSSSAYSQAISEIDGFNDIYYQIKYNNNTTTIENQQKADIDIWKVLSYVKEDAQTVDVSINVKGSIQDSESIHYIVWYNTTNASYYLNYSNGNNTGWATDTDTNERYYQIKPVQNTGHVITASYDLINGNSNYVDLWGYAYESNINESETQLWFDYVPNSKVPDDLNISYQDDDDDDNNQTIPDDSDKDNDKTSTPGFEIFLFIIATIILMIFNRRKRKI